MGYPANSTRKPVTPSGDVRQMVREEVRDFLNPYMERLQVLLGERGPKDKSQEAMRRGDVAQAVRDELTKAGLL